MSRSILIIDDEDSIRKSLGDALIDEGYSVRTASGGEQGLERLRAETTDIVVLDIWMPGIDGLETLRRIRAEWPEQVIVMMSGHGTIETAVKATKLGAFDFIEKPLSLERLLVVLQNAAAMLDLARENQALRKQSARPSRVLIGDSPAMTQVRELIRRIAPTTGSVLITGENGTGKELVAHNIHALSQRFSRPFVEVNCAAIPEELIESELFGHEKGAFTGATQLRRGKFDLANGGTLFLDEIGDMSLKTQAKILRILQEQKFERVGGTQTISVDVRIVAATNKDLRAEISKGHFREDLFYRLNVIPFHVPPLRDRRQDAPALARHFLAEFCPLHGRRNRELSQGGLDALMQYSWPGNVRELRNLMERLVILTSESEDGQPVDASTILAHLRDDAAIPVRGSAGDFGNSALPAQTNVAGSTSLAAKNLRDARQEFEKEFILRILRENDGNISRTAQILGVERSHLHRKMKGFGIETKDS